MSEAITRGRNVRRQDVGCPLRDSNGPRHRFKSLPGLILSGGFAAGIALEERPIVLLAAGALALGTSTAWLLHEVQRIPHSLAPLKELRLTYLAVLFAFIGAQHVHGVRTIERTRVEQAA